PPGTGNDRFRGGPGAGDARGGGGWRAGGCCGEGEGGGVRAVLAGGSVQARPDDVGLGLWNDAQEMRVDVPEGDAEARTAQYLGDSATGFDRDIAFVGQAPGKDEDVRLPGRGSRAVVRERGGVHQFTSGPGAWVPVSVFVASIPNICTSSSSFCTTRERRRTPSVMRSGVG